MKRDDIGSGKRGVEAESSEVRGMLNCLEE